MIFQSVDLNLFALFEALMRTRSVSASARELGVTPSAASHGLARLKRLLGDELFVTSPKGMQPTPRAISLAPDINEALGRLAIVLGGRSFHPGKEGRLFTIAAGSYLTVLLVPLVLRRIREKSPGSQLRVLPPGRLDVVQLLDEGRVDLLLGWFDSLPERLNRQLLLIEEESIVVREGHPLTHGQLTKERLLQHEHVVVEFTGSEYESDGGFTRDRGVLRRTWIERLLIETRQQGRKLPHVALTVPDYFDVPPVLRETDLVATLPRRLAEFMAVKEQLIILDLPYEPLAVEVEMIWHDRAVGDPGLRWLAAQTEAAAQELTRNEGQSVEDLSDYNEARSVVAEKDA